MIAEFHIQLPGNLTDDSIILDTVQLLVKNHLFVGTELVVTENESLHHNKEFTHQINICYNLEANKAGYIELRTK